MSILLDVICRDGHSDDFWESELEYMRLFSFPKNPFLNAHLQKFVYL